MWKKNIQEYEYSPLMLFFFGLMVWIDGLYLNTSNVSVAGWASAERQQEGFSFASGQLKHFKRFP